MSEKDELLIQMNAKLDKLDTRLDDMHSVQVKQAADIEHHIRRSDALEDMQKTTDTRVSDLEKHRNQAVGAAKLIGLVISILTIIELIRSLS